MPAAVANWLAYEDLANGHDLRVWANSGGEKIPREVVRSYAPELGTTTVNSVWDGSSITTFGARNEVISFAIVVDNIGTELDNLKLKFDLLESPATNYRLETTEHRVSHMFDWRQRPIEVFVVEYLRIHGLSRISYAFDDETHIPEKLRRPITFNIQPLAPAIGSGVWADRPHHDLSYPDIAIPQEVQEANGGTTLATDESQIFWIDIYIPKDAPAGVLSGTASLSQAGIELLSVPVEIEVLDFELPDERHSKTMVYIEPRDIKERYFTGVLGALAEADEQSYRNLINKHYMLAWRHGISLFDANEILPDQLPDVDKPNLDWIERLNGGLYTQSNGYTGPGQNLEHDLYVVGSYGAWAFWWDLLEYNPRNSAYDPDAPLADLEASLVANTSLWESWFLANSPDTTRIFYVDDEPGTDETLQYAETVASIVANSPLAGSQLGTLVTASPVFHGAQLPSPSILSALISEGDTPVWEATLMSNPDREYHMYNGKRPASGTFAIEDDGVALRELAWGQYKKNIDRWFYWHATYYNNTQGGPSLRDMSQIAGGEGESYRSGSHTNVFKSAHTFGGHQAEFDAVRGEAGFNYGNGDGVLFYPGTDHVFPTESRGLDGPIASLRIKHWRRGIQDVQYLALAADIDLGATNAIVETMVPEALWEIGVADPSSPSYVNKPPSWSNDPDLWEQARRDLATIIEPEQEAAPPEITTHPKDQTLNQGDELLLVVSATGNPTPTYQWQKDGEDIAGAVSATLTIAGVELTDAGSFHVTASNSEGIATSNVAIVVVEVDPSPAAPEFTSQPQSLSAAQGDTVTFSAEISGFPTPTLQWHKDNSPISGETSNTLVIDEVTADDAGVYELYATNDQGSSISNQAVLTIDEALVEPEIVSQPPSTSLTVGDALLLPVVAEGNPAPNYQWRKDGNDIPGATFASFEIAAVEESDAGTYVVAIANSEGSVVSDAAVVTVEPAPFAPEFTLQPQPVNATEGDTVTLNSAVAGLPQPTLQWHKDGAPIADETSTILTITTAVASDAGVYELHATNDEGTTISASAVVTVNEPITAPQILTQPQSATLTEGDTLQLVVVAEGNPMPTFQWRKDGSSIAGATSALLSIATIGESDEGIYDVVVTNSEDSVASNSALVVVNPAPVAPEFTLQPQSQTVLEGGSFELSVQVNGLPTPTLQWHKGGQPIAGAVGTSLTIPTVGTSDTGTYHVVATNSEGTTSSLTAALTVNPVTVSPTFSTQPQDQSVSIGDDVIITVFATGVPMVSYQWLKDGVAIAGETSSELRINTVALADAGEYSVQAINSAGQSTSEAAQLVVAAPQPEPANGQIAMVVADPSNLLTGDAALRNELETQGHVVTLFDDDEITTENSALNTLVVIAGSVNAGKLGFRLVNDPRPILVGKYTAYATMGLTGDVNGTDYGRLTSGDTIVVQPAGSLIGATAGDLEVLNRNRRIGWGAPALQAEVIATAVGTPNRATVFAYPQSTILADGTAAAGKRLALYLTGYLFNVASDEGDALLEQSVDWLLGDATPPTPSAPLAISAPTSVSVEEAVEVSFAASFSGNPTPTYQWLKDGVALSGATSTTLTVTASPVTAGSYALQASNSQGTALSESASLTLIVDQEPPTVVSVNALSLNRLQVLFSEPVTADSAETLTNYLLASGTAIVGAQLTDATTAELLTTELLPQSIETLLISNIADLSNNSMATVSEDFTTPAAPPPPSASAAIAMVVADPSNLLTGDAALRNELETQGHVVTLFDDDEITTENSALNTLVVIAGSVNAGKLGFRLVNDPRPILVGKYTAYATMGLTGDVNGTDYGRLTSGDTIVVQPAGSLIGATAGDLEVLNRNRRIGWGAPALQAEVIATAVGTPNRATVFAYPQSTILADGTAAAGKRLALYLTGYLFNVASDEGDALLEQSVDWLLGDATPPTPSAPLAISAPTSVSVEEAVEVSFAASFSGNPTPTYQWLKDGVALSGATSTTLTVTASPVTAGSYALQASNSQGTALSESASLTLIVDQEPPTVVSVNALSLNRLQVLFSEPVTADSAETLTNYLLASGTAIVGAQLTDATTAELLTTELLPQSIETLLISNIADLSNNSMATVSEDFTTPAAPPPPSASAAIAMVVADPSNLLTGDAALRNELETQGHVVTLFDDDEITTENSALNTLVVIAGSVNAGKLGFRLVNDPRPILVGKYTAYATMGLTGDVNGTDYGRLTSGDTIVVQPAGSLIGATAGDLEVLNRNRRIGWGAPALQAEVIATAVGTPNRATVFAYPQSTILADGTAAAGKRLALYLTGYLFNVASDEGDALLEQSVDWLLGDAVALGE